MKQKNKIFMILFSLMVILFVVLVSAVSWTGNDVNYQSFEDTAYHHNLSANITSPVSDMEFSIDTINTKIFWDDVEINLNQISSWIFIANSTTGDLVINATRDNQTGRFKIPIKVTWNNGNDASTASFNFTVNATNDAPVFVNLINRTFNMSELFEYTVNVSDEENNIPFVLNITFMNCSVAEWSTRNCSNSSGGELFNSSYYNFNSTSGVLNISFTPQRNDVGSYIINFSVWDNSSLGNKTTSQIVNFTVLNMNSAPYFVYICNNERNATENSQFTCRINVSDIDETNNLTFSSNYSWFTFYNNSALVTSLTVGCNSSTGYNASAMINFTPTDVNVGNWSINITVIDTGSPIRRNSTIFWFFINNTEDNVSLDEINIIDPLYQNMTLYVNATDDDLRVPDKRVKNETLTFASNTSWVNISSYSGSGNYITAKIIIDYDTARSIGIGGYTVKVNVTDTAGNFAERNFTITIQNDTAVVWNISNTFVIYENNLTYFNFSKNVTDAEGDSITFSFTNDSAFPSFGINSTTGIINFTPIDADVGYHNIIINASDGKLNSLRSFNFTIYNVNDNSSIEHPLTVNINASIDINSNINCTEDNVTKITLWVQDDDFKVLSGQKIYYNESLSVNLTIRNISNGIVNLFNFIRDPNFPTESGIDSNRTHYTATFTPGKADVGSYNVTINVTDLSNYSTTLIFNLTIFSMSHAPALMNLINQTSTINRTFYYRINATDLEDGNSNVSGGNTNFTFSYNFTSGSSFLNTTTFNSTTGEINITFNSSQGGKYHINITVNDSSGAMDFDSFWIYVYDTLEITLPASNYAFNLAENILSNLTFRTNHSIGDNLTFQIYIQNSSNTDVLKYNLSYYGNNTNLTWQFTPNFTEETHGVKNLTLIVINPTYPDLNASRVFNITINHTNAPITFNTNLGKHTNDYLSTITINLSKYFSDVDYTDVYYNQTVNFSINSSSIPTSIEWSVSGWTLSLTSLIQTQFTEFLTINATDINETNSSLTSALSNLFEVEFTTPATAPVVTPSSGGGGGGGSTIPVAFKIITPKEISAYAYQKIIIPLSLENKGNKDFEKINITVIAFKNGSIQNKVITSLDKSYIGALKKGASENLTLTVFFDTNNTGDYEILINATSQSPKYTDWAKMYISLQDTNESKVRELLIFTEELIAKNPECIEITEILNEAKKYFENGDIINAREKAEQAINACKEAIAQPGFASLRFKSPFTINEYILIASIGSMILGIVYYSIKRMRFKRRIESTVTKTNNENPSNSIK